ncbi:MAG: pyridoxal-phosphate dependent enzyme [Myxococcales bacterium]|nr:pyridoxal-phosphate dependent enzyme [Myxococcales bacterium]
MRFHENVLTAIGNTPLVRLGKLVGPNDAAVLLKCEFMNPGGSVKDRMALHILEKAERAGLLKPGGTIVENTSGNTGMGIALAAAVKGYRCIFTMPDKMSTEKINRLKALGAQVVVTPTNVPADDPKSYYETAKRIARETPGSFYVNQYHNPDNIEAHYVTTGPEIWEQTEGRIDYFVAGLGTGGTMSGAGKFFKEKKPAIRNIGVDPIGSVYQGYFKTKKLPPPHVYKVEGIGEDMLCQAMDFSVVDDVRQVDDRQCFVAARRLAREEGIFAGGSSGGAVHVAVELAKEVGRGKVIVCLLPDSGSSYISKFYSDEWMRDNGFLEERGPGTVADVIRSRQGQVIAARRGERIDQIIETMKRHGISQMPVVGKDDAAEGMIHEYDLLNALVSGAKKLSDPIDPIVAPLQGVVSPDTSIAKLREVFAEDNVAVVREGQKVVAIVTKIDLIDYLASRE